MTSIKEIDIDTQEGKLLLMAIAALTVSYSICLNGEEYNGRQLEPDFVLQEITKVAERVYKKEQDHPATDSEGPE